MIGEKADSKKPIMKRNAYIWVLEVAAAWANLSLGGMSVSRCAFSNFQKAVFAHVNAVHPSSQNMMQYRGRILRAIQVEGTCMMAKEMV